MTAPAPTPSAGLRLLGLAGLAALLGGAALVLWLLLADDDAPGTLETWVLRPPPRDVALGDDARIPLLDAAVVLVPLENPPPVELVLEDGSVLRPALQENAAALTHLAAAQRAPAVGSFSREEGEAVFGALLDLGRLAALAAVALPRPEDQREALLRGVELGGRLVGTGGSLVSLGGVSMQTSALDALAQQLAFAPPDAGAWRALLARLRAARPRPDDWRLVLAHDYVALVQDLERGFEEQGSARRIPWFFDLEATHALLAAEYRAAGDPFDAPCVVPRPERPPLRWIDYVRRNAIGHILVETAAPASLLDTRRCHTDLRLAAVAVLGALARWRDRHGALPDELGKLVPDTLSALPLDPFGGGALRYDPERAVVWSLGADGEDDGGWGSPDDTNDPTFPLPPPAQPDS